MQHRHIAASTSYLGLSDAGITHPRNDIQIGACVRFFRIPTDGGSKNPLLESHMLKSMSKKTPV